MTHHTPESWEEEFDKEVDRLVARSMRDPGCKPLTELKTFIAAQRLEAVAEFAREVVGKLNAREIELEGELREQGLSFNTVTAVSYHEVKLNIRTIRALAKERGIEL